jgi:hypothetical protein
LSASITSGTLFLRAWVGRAEVWLVFEDMDIFVSAKGVSGKGLVGLAIRLAGEKTHETARWRQTAC